MSYRDKLGNFIDLGSTPVPVEDDYPKSKADAAID